MASALVVYTRDWHPETTPHFAKDGGVWPVHCVGDTWGAEFHPDLVVSGSEIRKGTGGEDGYSGFTVRDPQNGAQSTTGLERLLRDAAITDVVVVGLATDYCVKETALDAARCGFTTTVLADGIRPVNLDPGDGARLMTRTRKVRVLHVITRLIRGGADAILTSYGLASALTFLNVWVTARLMFINQHDLLLSVVQLLERLLEVFEQQLAIGGRSRRDRGRVLDELDKRQRRATEGIGGLLIGQRHKHAGTGQGLVDPVLDGRDAKLLVVGSAFRIGQCLAMKRRRQMLLS